MKNNNKIAVVAPPWMINGTSCDNIIKTYLYLQNKYGYDITFFTDKKRKFSYPGLKTIEVSSPDFSNGFYKALWFLGLQRFYYPKLVKKLEGFDIIDTANPEFNIYAYQCYLAAKKYDSYLVLRQANTFFDFYLFAYTKSIALFFARRFARWCDCFMFINPDAEKAYINLGLIRRNDERVKIIGHAIDDKIFYPMPTKKVVEDKIILSVGSLIEVKGHQTIIRACADLLLNNDYELWIVGEGKYQQSLENLAHSLGVSDKVCFLGKKSQEELAMIYNLSSVLAFANEQEVTPCISEAMLCNLPVVAMNCGGLSYVIPSEEYGIVVEKDDISEFRAEIDYVLKSENNNVETARNHILENFTIEKVAEKMHICFQGIKL